MWLPSLFNDFLREEWPAIQNAHATPAINVLEDEHAYHIEIAAPGMTKDDVQLHVTNQNELVIKVEKKEEKGDKDCECGCDEKKEEAKCNCKYLRREFSYSRFEQTLTLPENVDKEAISAKVTDGILRIALPKLDPTVHKNPARVINIE